MDKHIGIWHQIVSSAKQQILSFIHQLPTNPELIDLAKKQQWIQYQNKKQGVWISLNEDLYTYLIYHSMQQEKNQKIYTDLERFNSIGIEDIVLEAVMVANPSLGNIIEKGMDDYNHVQIDHQTIIQKLMAADDVLDQEVFNMMSQEIVYKCHKRIQDSISQIQAYLVSLLSGYKQTESITQYYHCINIFSYCDFAKQPPEINEEFYKNFHIKQINDYTQLSQPLQTQQQGFFLFTIEKNQTMIFFETSPKQVAYVINPFDKDSKIIDEIQKQYKTYLIRMVNLEYKSDEQRYIIIQCMIKKDFEYKSIVSQFYEFYSNRHVQTCYEYYKDRYNQIEAEQKEITQFIQLINKEFTCYKKLLSPLFLKQLIEQRPQLQQNLLVTVTAIDFNSRYEPNDSLGVILVSDKILRGFRLKNQNSFVFYLPQNNEIQNHKCIITKVRQIDPEVASFYLSLIISNQEHISKNIKRFLEMKHSGLHFAFSLIK